VLPLPPKTAIFPSFHRFTDKVMSFILALACSSLAVSANDREPSIASRQGQFQARFHLSWASFLQEPVVFSMGRRRYFPTEEEMNSLNETEYYIIAERLDRFLIRGSSFCQAIGYLPAGREDMVAEFGDDTVWTLEFMETRRAPNDEAAMNSHLFFSPSEIEESYPPLLRVTCHLKDQHPLTKTDLTGEKDILSRLKETFGGYIRSLHDATDDHADKPPQ
jgi:hypothetical protein